MVKVYIAPNWYGEEDTGQGGIKRVWEAQVKYLPQFGIEVVKNVDEADVIANHGGSLIEKPLIPSVNHCHGLMWSRYQWPAGVLNVNRDVINSMKHAVAHTAPSEWVADAVKRGMLVYPEVIYHGIDTDEWDVGTQNPGNYVLWNKARADHVSNPEDMQDVAAMLPGVNFLTTIGRQTSNVRVMGVVPIDEMKHAVQSATVYLATARETFGIGTLEALACGVPVAGWDWGGQSEIIINGKTGYLAKPGDYEELAKCIQRCIDERAELSKNARADAVERWGWESRIEQYANLYKRVHTYYNMPKPKISVVITAYYLDKYLDKCIESVLEQSEQDWECFVIDDALSEETKQIVDVWTEKDHRIQYRRPTKNLGLPGARNFALKFCRGRYIRHLDADDWLDDRALELESKALDDDWGIHIAYGHLQNVHEDGSLPTDEAGNMIRTGWPRKEFSWKQQMAHLNQLPSCCMVRREVFDRSGGYRLRQRKAEDAHFWCLVTSLGFVAKKITERVTMFHRVREDSKGATEHRNEGSDGDWTAWFAWRLGAADYSQGRKAIESGREAPYNLVPFGAQGRPSFGLESWAAHDYAYPSVSIIVTVGPGHEKYLQDALDSVRSQTYPDWECLVVNDTGKEWSKNYWDSPLVGFPFAKYLSTEGNKGVSFARNLGAKHARGSALIWLDADDYWLPWLLERMVAMAEENRGIIYSDVLFKEGNELEHKVFGEFAVQQIVRTGLYPGSSVLIPRWIHDKIVEYQGGYDEQIPGMEDWDYQFAAHAIAGACAFRVEEPLFIYRFLPDGNREKHHAVRDKIVEYMDKKWKEYRKEGKTIMCGCSSKKKKALPASLMSSTGAQNMSAADPGTTEQSVLLEYVGESQGAFTLKGKSTKTSYRFGLQKGFKTRKVRLLDAKDFLGLRNQRGQRLFVVSKEEPPMPQDLKNFLLA